MTKNNDTKFLKEFNIDLKKLLKHFFILIILLVIFKFFSSAFHGKTIEIFEESYDLELLAMIIFTVVFFPIIAIILQDTGRILDLVSKFVIKRFPGMKEDVSPVLKIFRDIVYILLLFLVSSAVVPLFVPYFFIGVHLTQIVSMIFMILFLFFLYDIGKQIFAITKGHYEDFEKKILKSLNNKNDS
ncbi:hypothetical protein GF327_10390 [Candidatus Woesearchaeota archaeon]|nr:hypothetical protein [Candidatus Woesearchaeota archaeon]